MSDGPDSGGKTDAGSRVYRCGSILYTRKGLIFLFAWLLWGDMCFYLMETIIPSIMPLKLRSLGSSNMLIGLIMATLPGMFGVTISPWISFKSDRHRSRWGRRMPFILGTMPFITATLVLIAFADPIAAWLHGTFFQGTSCTRTAVTIGCLAVFAGLFDLFNMFVGSIYWYLFNDVVPQNHLARFMSYFRFVAVVTTALYNYFIYKYALSNMREIYLGVAVLYFFGFGLMCLKIKEGEYPPPEDIGQHPSLLRDIRVFVRECFTLPFYWDVFLYTTFSAVGACMGTFIVFFNQSLGLSLEQIGHMNAVNGVMIAVCLLFAGSLVDRWHPVRIIMYSSIWAGLTAFNNLIWLAAIPPESRVMLWILLGGLCAAAPYSAVVQAAGVPREMILLPKEQYGQFSGAQGVVRAVGTMTGGALAGLFLDMVKRFYEKDSLFPYRYIYIWIGFFTCVGALYNYRVYRSWKRLGAEDGYRPPLKRFRFKDLPPATEVRPAPKGPLWLFAFLFLGIFLSNAFLVWYFRFVMPDTTNVILFSAMVAVSCVEFWLFLRLVRFVERP